MKRKSISAEIKTFFWDIPMLKKQKSEKNYMEMKELELANVIFEFLTLFLINIQSFSLQIHFPPFPDTLVHR